MSAPTSLPQAIRQLDECEKKLNSLRMANVYGNMPSWIIKDAVDETNEFRAILRILIAACPPDFLPFVQQTCIDISGKNAEEIVKIQFDT